MLHSNSLRFDSHQNCFQDGDEDFDVVPGSKFVVSRTAFTDSSSYYKVDGKKCTFKDVGALLRKSGIDLDHSRFLILQVSEQPV